MAHLIHIQSRSLAVLSGFLVTSVVAAILGMPRTNVFISQPTALSPAMVRPYQPEVLQRTLQSVCAKSAPGAGTKPTRSGCLAADTSATGLAAVWADVHRRSYFLDASTGASPKATNAAQHIAATLASDQYTVAALPNSKTNRSAWQVRWRLQDIGRAGAHSLALAPDATPAVVDNKVAFGAGNDVAVEYENTPAGVRQTFVLARRPAGAGPVQVRLHVDTSLRLTAAADGSVITFSQVTGGGPVLRYDDLRAWDATGRVLPAHLQLGTGHDLALIVNDANADYPITVDPLASTPSLTLSDPGGSATSGFGRAADAGDVNGDGYADVVVGAYNTTSGQGKAYLYLGSSTGISNVPTTTFSDPAATANDYFGISACSAGDVNGDGYTDVVVGAYGTNSYRGKAYVYLGNSTGLYATPSATLTDPANIASDRFGYSVAGVGDVNGDGYADVMISADGTNTNRGRAYCYFGSSGGLATSPSIAISNPTGTSDAFGTLVAGAGDVNGDGYADVLINAYTASTGRGKAYFFLGSSAGPSTSPNTTLFDPGNVNYDYFSYNALSGVGDVNGDGYCDVMVGAYNTSGGQGKAYLYSGTASGLNPTPVTLSEPVAAANNYFGSSVAGVGDVNGDGYADVMVGAYGVGGNQGKAYFYLGSSAGLSAPVTFLDPGGAANDIFGYFVGHASDINGDGYSDFFIGGNIGGQSKTHVYYGSTDLLLTTPSTTRSDPAATGSDYYGGSVAAAGDVNADGYADVVIGARGTSSFQGKAYVYLGSTTGLGGTAATVLAVPGATSSDQFGGSVAGAGDVNGDGYTDVVVGASDSNSRQGKAYLYLGSASGLSTTAATVLADPAAAADDYFGSVVASAGDVNGDGYSDVVIGAPGTSTAQGRAYFYLGSSVGLATTPTRVLAEPAAVNFRSFGTSVAGAGDVNGDGYSDVVIGAYGISGTPGNAYIYLGSRTGLASAPAATLTDPGATSYNYFGSSVAGAGDVDGDGYADVVVGAYNTSSGQGKVYVYKGSSTGVSNVSTVVLADPAATSGDNFGGRVTGAGDVNGDGYADIMIGAMGSNSGRGRAYLYLGSSTGLAVSPGISLADPGAVNGNNFGTVEGVGDVNGDGYADVMAGAAGTTGAQGKIYFYPGNFGVARRGALRLYNTDLSAPLSSTNRPLAQFGIGLVARSAHGWVRARLVWEAVANGVNFSHNSPITNSTAFTGRGAYVAVPVAGLELKALVSKVGKATRVRARLEYAPSGVGGVARYTPWSYVTNQLLGQNATGVPLPVVLSAFTAKADETGVQLNWATALERNSSHFGLERSADGLLFAQIAQVAAHNTNSPSQYAFHDELAFANDAIRYYRLRQVDQDGTAAYSPVQAVWVAARGNSLRVYPNPASSSCVVRGALAGSFVEVYNATGQLVLRTLTANTNGSMQLFLPANWPLGVYLVRNNNQTCRLTIE